MPWLVSLNNVYLFIYLRKLIKLTHTFNILFEIKNDFYSIAFIIHLHSFTILYIIL